MPDLAGWRRTRMPNPLSTASFPLFPLAIVAFAYAFSVCCRITIIDFEQQRT
jgi:hypothetical protein